MKSVWGKGFFCQGRMSGYYSKNYWSRPATFVKEKANRRLEWRWRNERRCKKADVRCKK